MKKKSIKAWAVVNRRGDIMKDGYSVPHMFFSKEMADYFKPFGSELVEVEIKVKTT